MINLVLAWSIIAAVAAVIIIATGSDKSAMEAMGSIVAIGTAVLFMWLEKPKESE